MFSLKVVDTDLFLDMSPSAQNLYFHLGMRADDDGFVSSPKKIASMVNAADNDFQILIAKGFIIPMSTSGICVVTHWKTNNLIKSDRYTETEYKEEKARLIEIEGKYTFAHLLTTRQKVFLGSKMVPEVEPQVRLGKVSKTTEIVISEPLREVRENDSERVPKAENRAKDKGAVYQRFSRKKEPWMIFAHQRKSALALFDRGLDKLDRGLEVMRDHSDDQFCPQASTPTEYIQKMPQLNRYIKRNNL